MPCSPDAAAATSAPPEPAVAAGRLAEEAARIVSALEPADALRFLFELDTRLYAMQGKASVAYGGGIHTKHRHIRYHDFFVQRIAAHETVLDIGCGHGAVALAVASATGAKVTGIDLSEGNLRIARERHTHPNVTYIHGNACRDLPAGHYDVVILSNVLEHIEHRVEFLRQVQAAATPHRWLVRVPLFERDWRVPLKKELGLDWRLDRTHFTEYTHEGFLSETTAAGLAVTYHETRWGEIWAELLPNCE